MRKLDNFNKSYEDHIRVQQALEGLKEPKTKAGSKQTLVDMINDSRKDEKGNFRAPLNPYNSPEHLIESDYSYADRFYGENPRNYMRDNSDEVISEIPENKLVDNLLDIVPMERKGDDKHNERAGAHQMYLFNKTAYDYLEGKDDEKTVARARGLGLDKLDKSEVKKELIKGASEGYIKKELEKFERQLRAERSLSDEAIEYAKSRLVASYIVQGVLGEEAERAYKDYVPKYIKDFEKEFNGKFGSDGERAEYSRSNLRALVDKDIDAGMQGVYFAAK